MSVCSMDNHLVQCLNASHVEKVASFLGSLTVCINVAIKIILVCKPIN